MNEFKIDLKTHRGFLLLHSDLLGYLSPLWAHQGSGLPRGAHPIHTHRHTDTHTKTHTHTHTPRETLGRARGREPGLRPRLHARSTLQPPEHRDLVGGTESPHLLAGLTLGGCRPVGGSPAPPWVPSPLEASPLSSDPHTSICHAVHPERDDTVWGGSCHCGHSSGWG